MRCGSIHATLLHGSVNRTVVLCIHYTLLHVSFIARGTDVLYSVLYATSYKLTSADRASSARVWAAPKGCPRRASSASRMVRAL